MLLGALEKNDGCGITTEKKAQLLVWEKASTLWARSRDEDGNAQSSPQPPLNQPYARGLGVHGYCRGMT